LAEAITRAAEGEDLAAEGDLEDLVEEVPVGAGRTSEKTGSRFKVRGSRSQVSVLSYEL
jgi:hypothetical protein